MLRPHAEDLWTLDRPFRVLSLEVGMRMTVIRTPARELLLISPVALGEEDVAALRALGEVSWVLSPNLLHHLHAQAALARFPGAKLYTAPGLREKRRDLVVEAVLGQPHRYPFTGTLDQMMVGGMPALNEVALLHRASRTLILTDLIFNLHRADGWLQRAYLRWTGCWQRPGQTLLERWMVKDRAVLRTEREALLGWDFDRVIVAHGEVIETGGKAALAGALAWLG